MSDRNIDFKRNIYETPSTAHRQGENYMKTKEIINIVTQDENICPVCGASIKPEYSNWNDCYEYYNWECQQCEAKGTAVYKMIRNFEEHIDIEKGEQL